MRTYTQPSAELSTAVGVPTLASNCFQLVSGAVTSSSQNYLKCNQLGRNFSSIICMIDFHFVCLSHCLFVCLTLPTWHHQTNMWLGLIVDIISHTSLAILWLECTLYYQHSSHNYKYNPIQLYQQVTFPSTIPLSHLVTHSPRPAQPSSLTHIAKHSSQPCWPWQVLHSASQCVIWPGRAR